MRKPSATLAVLTLLGGLVLGAAGAPLGGDERVDYATEIRPLLSDRCFQCHGPDRATVAADLRLDRADSARADRGGYAAIVPGDPDASELVYRISTDFDLDRMPPPESKLELAPDEVELIRRWIAEGAEVATHWAFERPERHVPVVATLV